MLYRLTHEESLFGLKVTMQEGKTFRGALLHCQFERFQHVPRSNIQRSKHVPAATVSTQVKTSAPEVGKKKFRDQTWSRKSESRVAAPWLQDSVESVDVDELHPPHSIEFNMTFRTQSMALSSWTTVVEHNQARWNSRGGTRLSL